MVVIDILFVDVALKQFNDGFGLEREYFQEYGGTDVVELGNVADEDLLGFLNGIAVASFFEGLLELFGEEEALDFEVLQFCLLRLLFA